MITTGANPQAAIIMSDLKNNFGKSVSKGIGNAALIAAFPAKESMERAARSGYYAVIRALAGNQCREGQE